MFEVGVDKSYGILHVQAITRHEEDGNKEPNHKIGYDSMQISNSLKHKFIFYCSRNLHRPYYVLDPPLLLLFPQILTFYTHNTPMNYATESSMHNYECPNPASPFILPIFLI